MKHGMTFGLVIILQVVSPVQAEIYKWTDEQGRVHFSDKPPGQDALQYQLRESASTDKPPAGTNQTEAERRRKQHKLMESLEAERIEKEQAAAKQKQHQAVRARNCQHAQAELRASKEANLIYNYDASGNKVYLSEAQKQKYLQAKTAAVQKWCD